MMISPSEERNSPLGQILMSIEEVFQYVREELELVEKILVGSLHSDVLLISQVGQYIFRSGGKRMRPLLTILSSKACDYSGSSHLAMAAVVELIHTATLLHDDVVDHADLRRGSRSVNYIWNSETSILVGDYLFTRAFCTMVDHRDMRILDLMSSTCRQLAEGEILELAKSGDPKITEEDYLAIVRAKTAVLISAACRMGAILGNRQEWEEDLAAFGMNLGMAFQLVDDVLDYAAEQEELGKTIGKDLNEGKVTLPVIRTLARSTHAERERLSQIIRSRSQDPQDLQEILETIHGHDGLDYTHEMARRYVQEAKARLTRIPESRDKASLLAVADFVASRRN
ncbi:MAG: polyprenyl synthetase family protein [Thermodesulfobacteriota bacterium]